MSTAHKPERRGEEEGDKRDLRLGRKGGERGGKGRKIGGKYLARISIKTPLLQFASGSSRFYLFPTRAADIAPRIILHSRKFGIRLFSSSSFFRQSASFRRSWLRYLASPFPGRRVFQIHLSFLLKYFLASIITALVPPHPEMQARRSLSRSLTKPNTDGFPYFYASPPFLPAPKEMLNFRIRETLLNSREQPADRRISRTSRKCIRDLSSAPHPPLLCSSYPIEEEKRKGRRRRRVTLSDSQKDIFPCI